MTQQKSIFEDQTGRRASVVKKSVLSITVAVSIVLTAFLFSIAVISPVIRKPHKIVEQLSWQFFQRDRIKASVALQQLRPKLKSETPAPRTSPALTETVSLAFYMPWEASALDSLRAHVGAMSHLAPVWLRLTPDGSDIDFKDFNLESNPNNGEIISLCKTHSVRMVPLLSNATDDEFSAARLKPLLHDQKVQAALIEKIATWLKTNDFQGLNLDFEEISDHDYGAFGAFVEKLAARLHADSLELSVDVQTAMSQTILKRLASAADFLVLMAYDQHYESGAPGPIASVGWTDSVLDEALADIPEEKVVLGIGSYAYDWPSGGTKAESISFQEALATAEGYRDNEAVQRVIRFDPDSFNSYFEYVNDSGEPRVVWILDALSGFNQWRLGRQRGLRGAALWALGSEDPSVWEFLSKDLLRVEVPAEKLQRVKFPFEVTFSGKGEILSVESRPQNGERTITVDQETGLIDGATYTSYPATYLIKKEGFKKNKLVLTFDDGPDGRFTNSILDTLKEYSVPAAFFWIGENIEANPTITRRAFDEGHEIGNHSFTHPNLGTVSNERVQLELNATQRIIESITGHSSILFRPPYNADSQPETVDQVKPIDFADTLGYITVGENVDPTDWDPIVIQGDGTTRKRLAQDIVDDILSDLDRRRGTGEEGNIILLHDSGGNREETIKALKQIIPKLRALGYTFTTIGDLLNLPREKLMPRVHGSARIFTEVNAVVFNLLYWMQSFIFFGFISALALGIGRIFIVLPLAILHARRAVPSPDHVAAKPSVSVLIAAFNEEKTIANTIHSILQSAYPIEEVIVVDDGSKDDTSGVVQREFQSDSRVRLIRKENGGKASALTIGITQAIGELVLCIDADTQINAGAVGELAKHFIDPSIGAVAGNVHVGNVNNVLTAWQSVEYRTSQNMDRRAFAFLNAVTVVPGAIGMWRKDAVMRAGGYLSDTLAEDMDLTWRMRRLGYRFETEPKAEAFTEAPETWSALRKQRFRWAYGTLQCLFKHRHAIGRYGWFGTLSLPMLWLFQIGFQILGPLVDLQILFSAIDALWALIHGTSQEIGYSVQIETLEFMLGLYALFFGLELVTALIAYRMDREPPWPLVWLFLQRFAYRQLMYVVMLQSLWRAATGMRQGWGKLQRVGSVRIASDSSGRDSTDAIR